MKTKRRNITVRVLSGFMTTKQEIVLATDTIARIEPVVGTAPVHMEGARAIIFLKGKDAGLLYAMEDQEAILAKIEAPEPTDRAAVLRLRRKPTANESQFPYPEVDVVAFYDKTVLLRTRDGLWPTDIDTFHSEYLAHYEEV